MRYIAVSFITIFIGISFVSAQEITTAKNFLTGYGVAQQVEDIAGK